MCRSTDARPVHRFVAPGAAPQTVVVLQCPACGFVFCDPIPSSSSSSAGPISVHTEEAFTEGLLQRAPTPERAAELARRRARELRLRLGTEQPLELLEVGCGTAWLASHYAEQGVRYRGIDIDPRVIAAARRRGVTEVEVADVMEYGEPGRYDVIWCSQVLEHIIEPHRFVDRLAELLRPTGLLVCDVPNHRALAGSINGWLARLPAPLARATVRYGGITWPHHAFAYDRRSLHRLLSPRFSPEVFTANVDDPTWGQVNALGLVQRLFFAVGDRLDRRSLLVGVARLGGAR